MENLTNTNYFFGYSQACYAGAFDNRNDTGSYLEYDCIAERFITSEYGAFAFIANTRYGVSNQDTNSPSQNFDREFFDALFGENNRSLGKANQDSKQDNIGKIKEFAMRFCYYEITLFGDPELSIKDPPLLEEPDVCVYRLDAPEYLLVNTSTCINATIYNRAVDNETDLVVNLSIDDDVVGSERVDSLNSSEYKVVSFIWSANTAGVYNVSVEVMSVPGETNIDNNVKSAQIMVTSLPVVKVFVLDSAGSDIFNGKYDVLNQEWQNYGAVPVAIDYTTLNCYEITSEKLNASGADVLVVDYAFFCPEWPIVNFEYTDAELDAIIRYVEEGHGLIVTADSFGGKNSRLLPLVGLREDLPRVISGGLKAGDFYSLVDNLSLFGNLSDPFHSIGYVTSIWINYLPQPWIDDYLSAGTYVAKTDDNSSVVVENNGSIYISPSFRHLFNTNDSQLLYNAMLWTCFYPPPATPTGLAAVPGDTFANLYWNLNPEDDIYYYSIYRSTSQDTEFEKIVQVDGKTNFHQDTELIIDTTYYYKITTTDLGGSESDFSTTINTTTHQSIQGDVNNDGNIDIADVVYLSNYLFINGPEPPILAAADANGDGQVDIADIMYLINYLFI
jgi:hypothetical protein